MIGLRVARGREKC